MSAALANVDLRLAAAALSQLSALWAPYWRVYNAAGLVRASRSTVAERTKDLTLICHRIVAQVEQPRGTLCFTIAVAACTGSCPDGRSAGRPGAPCKRPGLDTAQRSQ